MGYYIDCAPNGAGGRVGQASRRDAGRPFGISFRGLNATRLPS